MGLHSGTQLKEGCYWSSSSDTTISQPLHPKVRGQAEHQMIDETADWQNDLSMKWLSANVNSPRKKMLTEPLVFFSSSIGRPSKQPNVFPRAILEGVLVRGKKPRTPERSAGKQTRSLHRRAVLGQRSPAGLLGRVRRRRRRGQPGCVQRLVQVQHVRAVRGKSTIRSLKQKPLSKEC